MPSLIVESDVTVFLAIIYPIAVGFFVPTLIDPKFALKAYAKMFRYVLRKAGIKLRTEVIDVKSPPADRKTSRFNGVRTWSDGTYMYMSGGGSTVRASEFTCISGPGGGAGSATDGHY